MWIYVVFNFVCKQIDIRVEKQKTVWQTFASFACNTDVRRLSPNCHKITEMKNTIRIPFDAIPK